MLKKSIFLGLFFSLLFLIPNASYAADWYVNGSLGTDDGAHGTAIDGDAWATVSYALTGSRVSKGDTIHVQAGTYITDQTVVAVGAGDGNPVTVQNYNNDVVTIQTHGDVSGKSGVFFVNTIDMVWDGIDFDNNNVAMADKFIFGIYSTTAPVNFTFQNGTIDGERASGQIRLFDLYGSQPHNLTINKAEIINGGYVVEVATSAATPNEVNIYSSVIYNAYVCFYPTSTSATSVTLLNNVLARFSGYGFFLSHQDTEIQAENNIFLNGGSNSDTVWNLGTDFAVETLTDNDIFDVEYNYYYSEDSPFVLATFGDIITSTQVVPYIPEENHFVDPDVTSLGTDYTLNATSLLNERGSTQKPPDGTDLNGVAYGSEDVGPYANSNLVAMPALNTNEIGWHGASTMYGVGASGESTKAVTIFDNLTDEDVNNYAMGGQFSRGLFFAIDQSIWDVRESRISFAIGANDMITPRAQQTPAQVAENIIRIMNKIDSAGMDFSYLGLSSVMGSPPDNADTHAVYDLISAECSNENWECGHILDQFEFNEDWDTEYYDDIATDAHPNDDGHAIIARLAEYLFFDRNTIGDDGIDIGAGARIFADGEFRDLGTPNGEEADFAVTPVGGASAFDSDNTSLYLDITIDTWKTSGSRNKEWTASASTGASYFDVADTVYTIGDLNSNSTYQFKLDGSASTDITSDDCTGSYCQADSSGDLEFTYTGGYSSHTFALDHIDEPSAPTSLSPSGTDVALSGTTSATPASMDGTHQSTSWKIQTGSDCSADSGVTWSSLEDSTNKTSASYSGLSYSTTYYLCVANHNQAGQGEWASQSFATLAEPVEEEPEEEEEEQEEPVNSIDDIGLVSGTDSGAGVITVYDNDNNELCSVQAWSKGGVQPYTIRLNNDYYIAAIKNKVGSTIHIYDLNCNVVEKKRLSQKLHPRRMVIRNFMGKNKYQEIAVTSRRGSTVYGKIFRYNIVKDKWYLLKQKTFRPVPTGYNLKKTKKGNVLIQKDNQTLHKWSI